MKRFFSILAVVAFTFALTSCGSDDETPRPTDLPKKGLGVEQTYSYNLDVPASSSVTTSKVLKLSDFNGMKKEWEDFISDAKVRGNSNIKISGISKNNHKITELTLKIAKTDILKKFATSDKNAVDGTFNFKKDLDFLREIMNQLRKEKEVTLEIIIKTEKKINNDVNVTLNFDVLFEF